MPNRHNVEPKVVEVISGRNPYQLYFMVLLLISGLSILLTAPAPQSLERAFPAWLLTAWGAGLFVSSAMNLVAVLIHWRDRLTGMWFEIVSCVVLASAGGLYTFATLLYHQPNTSYIGIGIISALLGASIWRAIQLYIWIKKIRAIREFYKPITDIKE